MTEENTNPDASPNRYYLTTPIYYVNARPHLGHAYSTIVCDAIARRKRALGIETWFLTGTDEHGQKIERSAELAGRTPAEFATAISVEFRGLWDRLGLTYDDFIRTTSERHRTGVQKLFTALQQRGFIYKGSYNGQYCVSDEAYVDGPPGTPCPDCGRMTETVSEENYFFKLSAFERMLLEFYEANPGFMGPESTRREVISFVRGGLKDLSVSRTSFSWGIPVPGDEKHVVYVWLDALANYITALGYGSDNLQDQEKFAKFWPADMHLIGKEISRFHCVYWPAFLMAAGIAPPRSVRANGWLLFDQGKMSKSRGNIVRAETVLEVLGADALRYFLLREIPFGQDGSFQLRRIGPALQRRPRQRLRQPGEPRREHDAQVLRRCGAGGRRRDVCREVPSQKRCASHRRVRTGVRCAELLRGSQGSMASGGGNRRLPDCQRALEASRAPLRGKSCGASGACVGHGGGGDPHCHGAGLSDPARLCRQSLAAAWTGRNLRGGKQLISWQV